MYQQLDAIETTELVSGKDEARNKRKSLNIAVESLLKKTQDLHNEFAVTVNKFKSGTDELLENDAAVVVEDNTRGVSTGKSNSRNHRRRYRKYHNKHRSPRGGAAASTLHASTVSSPTS